MLNKKKFSMRAFALAIVLSLLQIASEAAADVGFCSAESAETKSDCEGDDLQTYSLVSNDILGKIEAAEADHRECREGGCKCYEAVIDSDLAKFPKVTRKMLADIRNAVKHSVVYQIIVGRVYRSPEKCLFPLRCRGVEHFLLELAPKFKRDTEFAVNFHDWPHISERFHQGAPLPLFSFSKTAEYSDVFYPAWTFWSGGPATDLYPTGLGRWDLFRERLKAASQATPWDSKAARGFFRGSRTSAERDPLVRLSRRSPELLDAQYTKNQAWKSPADTLGADPAAEVALEDHCKYRFLFNFRGVAASFRLKHLFLCGSLVFHVGDEWDEFFYSALQPWVHYVPVDAGAGEEEIERLLRFFADSEEGDALGRRIAERGRNFIRDNLRMADVECYWRTLLEKYSELLDFEPNRGEEYVEVVE